MVKIFISHSSRDKQTIINIIEKLPKSIKGWIDQDQIIAGENIPEKVKSGINDSDLFLLFLSPEAIKSDWVKKEIELALEKEKEQPFKMQFLIPIKMTAVDEEEYGRLFPDAKDRKFLKLTGYEDKDISNLAAELRSTIESWTSKFFEEYKKFQNLAQNARGHIAPDATRLWIKITDRADTDHTDLWNDLEDLAVQAVINGGITAMSYYKKARRTSQILNDTKNPSYNADLQSTISILSAFDSRIKKHVHELGCNLYYLGEETVYKDEILKSLGGILVGEISKTDEFFKQSRNSIRVIIDAIDGTSNFVRGVPFFCSSIAIFIEEQLRISAIYDPLHHQVYSGLLPGPHANPLKNARANVWDITSGSNQSLKDAFKNFLSQESQKSKKSLAIHIPRSDVTKRDEFIAPGKSGEIMLKKFAEKVATIYALNSGLLAMAQVANCALDGFVNIVTNLWDVAAGEVIIKACGGQVTNFEGKAINYASPETISVLAVNSESFHRELLEIIKSTKNR